MRNIAEMKIRYIVYPILMSLAANFGCTSDKGKQEGNFCNSQVCVKFLDENESIPGKDDGFGWKKNVHIPQITSVNNKGTEKINQELKELVAEPICESKEGDYFFSAELTLLSEKHLSFKYDEMEYCVPMPHPASYSGGITFSLKTSKKISLAEEIKNNDLLDKLKKDVLKKAKDKLQEDDSCSEPEPEFSEKYYMNANSIVFIEFFPFHSDSACEIEVEMPISEMTKYLKSNSELGQ